MAVIRPGISIVPFGRPRYFDSEVNRQAVINYVRIHGKLKGCIKENPNVECDEATFKSYLYEKAINNETGVEEYVHQDFHEQINEAIKYFQQTRLENKPEVYLAWLQQLEFYLIHGYREERTTEVAVKDAEGNQVYGDDGKPVFEPKERIVITGPIPKWVMEWAERLFKNQSFTSTNQLQVFMLELMQSLREADFSNDEQLRLVEFLRGFEQKTDLKIRALKGGL
jgi:hypothetical protein